MSPSQQQVFDQAHVFVRILTSLQCTKRLHWPHTRQGRFKMVCLNMLLSVCNSAALSSSIPIRVELGISMQVSHSRPAASGDQCQEPARGADVGTAFCTIMAPLLAHQRWLAAYCPSVPVNAPQPELVLFSASSTWGCLLGRKRQHWPTFNRKTRTRCIRRVKFRVGSPINPRPPPRDGM